IRGFHVTGVQTCALPISGKGTQAALMVEALGLPHISTGVLLRAAVTAGTKLGQAAKAVMDRGDLVSDDIMLGLIEERLSEDDVEIGRASCRERGEIAGVA